MYYMFRPIAAAITYIECLQPICYQVNLPTLASDYTLGVRCTSMFLYNDFMMQNKFIKY
jgi:hypothetical protein